MVEKIYPLHDPENEASSAQEHAWNMLTQHEQQGFINRAAFLLNRGYVQEETILHLSKRLAYAKSLKSNTNFEG